MDSTTAAPEQPSVLAILRGFLPKRRLTLEEALRIAELQAESLLRLSAAREAPISEDIVRNGCRLLIEYDFDMPETASGVGDWHQRGRRWVITINGHNSRTRQRFTVLHEYKHIVDHRHAGLTRLPDRLYYGLTAAEFVADYFAGCVLMPRSLVKRSWAAGVRNPLELASQFDVSERAMTVRLRQLHLAAIYVPNHRDNGHGPGDRAG